MKRRTRTSALALVVATGVGLGAPTAAEADHWWWWNNTTHVVHLNRGHTPELTMRNRSVGAAWTPLEHARNEWAARSWAINLTNWDSPYADLTAWDGNWCTPWSGLATPVTNAGGSGTVYFDGHAHADWMSVQINTCSNSYASGANYNGTRAVACQEIGHAVGGMMHQGPGCMGLGYFNFNPNDPPQRWPSAHDVDHVDWLWSGWH